MVYRLDRTSVFQVRQCVEGPEYGYVRLMTFLSHIVRIARIEEREEH